MILKKKKIILFYIFSFCVLTNIHASEGDVWLSEITQIKGASESFSINVNVDSGNKNAGALNFSVSYDSEKIEVIDSVGSSGIEKGNDASNYLLAVNPGEDSIRFALTTFSDFSSGDDLHMATIHFKTKSNFEGSTNINILTHEITDNKASSLDLMNSVNSGATINSPSSNSGGNNADNSIDNKAKLWISPKITETQENSEVILSLRTNSYSSELGAINLNLNYDSSQLILDNTKGVYGIEKGDNVSNYAMAVNPGDNTVRFALTSSSNYINSGDAELAKIYFKTTSDFNNQTEVSIQANEITNENASEVSEENINTESAIIKYVAIANGGNGGTVKVDNTKINTEESESIKQEEDEEKAKTENTTNKAIQADILYPNQGQIISNTENDTLYIVGTTNKPSSQVSIMITDSAGKNILENTESNNNGAWKVATDISVFKEGKVKITGVFIDSDNMDNKSEVFQSFIFKKQKEVIIEKTINIETKPETEIKNSAAYSEENIFNKTGDYEVKSYLQSCDIIDNLLDPIYDDSYITSLNDIGTNKYKEYILRLEKAGIVNGDSNKNFSGDRGITRAELLAILLQVHCYDFSLINNNPLPFIDVTNKSWQYKVVKKAYDLDIADGDIDKFNNPVFRPNDYVSRAEAIALIMNMGILYEDSNIRSGFIDLEAPWQENYISRAVSLNIINSNVKIFNPQDSMSRNDFIKYLFNTIKLYKN